VGSAAPALIVVTAPIIQFGSPRTLDTRHQVQVAAATASALASVERAHARRCNVSGVSDDYEV